MKDRNILIIDEAYIKENSSVYNDVEPKSLTMHIYEAQNINLYELLKDGDLYDAIFDSLTEYNEYRSGGGTDSVEDWLESESKTYIYNLILEVQPMLMYWTLYRSMIDSRSKWTNKGDNTQSSEYSDKTELSYFYDKRKTFKDNAEYYDNRVINFLKDNSDDYTDYTTDNCDVNSNTFSNALYLGDSI